MREIIEQIKRIEEEQLRRKNSPLASYNTGDVVHEKQIEFHKCPKKNKWVFGGNRSGKTECGAVECVWIARGIHPYLTNRANTEGWVVSLSTQVQRDVAQKKIMHYLEKSWIEKVVMSSGSQGSAEYGVIDYILVKNVFGGISKIGFKSCEAGREKFAGTSLDYVWFDEEPPLDVYQECQMRVLDRAGRIFGTMTPLKGLSWVYDEIFLNVRNSKEVWCIFMEWADNPFLPAEEVEYMTESLSEESLNSRRYGKFGVGQGLVYSEFDPSIHVIQPFEVPAEWQDKLSIDPGLNNPLSCHWYAVDGDGNVYVVAEHYESKKDVNYHAEKIKEISRRLNWHADSRGRYEALIDSAANQRTLACSKSVAELFYDNGIAVNTKVNKDVFSGINRVKEYLKVKNGRPKLFIFENCVNMIREIKGYWWGANDSPKKVDDHAMDELRYYISSKPLPPKQPTQTKTAIELDKERLFRRLNEGRNRLHF